MPLNKDLGIPIGFRPDAMIYQSIKTFWLYKQVWNGTNYVVEAEMPQGMTLAIPKVSRLIYQYDGDEADEWGDAKAEDCQGGDHGAGGSGPAPFYLIGLQSSYLQPGTGMLLDCQISGLPFYGSSFGVLWYLATSLAESCGATVTITGFGGTILFLGSVAVYGPIAAPSNFPPLYGAGAVCTPPPPSPPPPPSDCGGGSG